MRSRKMSEDVPIIAKWNGFLQTEIVYPSVGIIQVML